MSLVKVYGASVTFCNLLLVTGEPFPLRLIFGGFSNRRLNIPGSDIAGRVEAVGGNVKQFQTGDEVFGDLSNCGRGGFAEYVCAPENELGLKPGNLSFEEAAAVPEAALVALQALRDMGRIQKGQKVLIYGASGGIGTFAVQIAKYFGAEVTGVCGAGNLDLVRSLGADHVIDYAREDFTRNGQRYDLILREGIPFHLRLQARIEPRGNLYLDRRFLGPNFPTPAPRAMISKAGSKKLGGMTVIPNQDLAL